jgi:serine protease
MKRWVASFLLTSSLWTAFTLSNSPWHQGNAQTQTSSNLFYTFYGQQIPLTLRQDTIAVSFRPTVGTRGSGTPLYLQLQQDLQGGNTRSRGNRHSSLEVEVKPLGENYALVTLPSEAQSRDSINQQIQQRSYVETVLPVLTLSESETGENGAEIVLPNEIIVSFEPDLSNTQIQTILNRHGLEVVRSLLFTENRYIVRSRIETGVAVLDVANRLNGAVGIQSATPNFVQSLAYQVQTGMNGATLTETPDAASRLQQILSRLPALETPYPASLQSLAWHLNSTPQRGSLLPRTDIRATEAWEQSNGGEGTVVAVIDSLIQWDHPDLSNNIHTVNHPNLFPGEVHGWDFSNDQVTCSSSQPDACIVGDADTRISREEMAILRPDFQNTFRLSTDELLQEYADLTEWLTTDYPNLSTRELAGVMRNMIRNTIAAEFHGTWAAGVIAAHPETGQGTVGVAPEAEILPVRVFGLNGEITAARLIEAIGYAADRDADVINMSLRGLLPDQGLTDQIFQVLDQHPNLVIVASAGNDSLDGVGFPAATPGVLSVGATNLDGKRTFYSSFGGRLDVVAPGGETDTVLGQGILTTGGTWLDGFWEGLIPPNYVWGYALDPRGQYVQVQGTSFSAPAVSGVVALMKGVNPGLSRDRLLSILKTTSSYDGLTLSQADRNYYRLQREVGLTQLEDRLSGIFPLPQPISAEQYFFGSGLVNAEAAVRATKRM